MKKFSLYIHGRPNNDSTYFWYYFMPLLINYLATFIVFSALIWPRINMDILLSPLPFTYRFNLILISVFFLLLLIIEFFTFEIILNHTQKIRFITGFREQSLAVGWMDTLTPSPKNANAVFQELCDISLTLNFQQLALATENYFYGIRWRRLGLEKSDVLEIKRETSNEITIISRPLIPQREKKKSERHQKLVEYLKQQIGAG